MNNMIEVLVRITSSYGTQEIYSVRSLIEELADKRQGSEVGSVLEAITKILHDCARGSCQIRKTEYVLYGDIIRDIVAIFDCEIEFWERVAKEVCPFCGIGFKGLKLLKHIRDEFSV